MGAKPQNDISTTGRGGDEAIFPLDTLTHTLLLNQPNKQTRPNSPHCMPPISTMAATRMPSAKQQRPNRHHSANPPNYYEPSTSPSDSDEPEDLDDDNDFSDLLEAAGHVGMPGGMHHHYTIGGGHHPQTHQPQPQHHSHHHYYGGIVKGGHVYHEPGMDGDDDGEDDYGEDDMDPQRMGGYGGPGGPGGGMGGGGPGERMPSGSSKSVGMNGGMMGAGSAGAGEGDDDEEGEGWSDETGQEIVESKKDKRRREYTERMQRLNHDFMENKERIYSDKLKAFQSELRAIQDGTQPEFLERLADLEETREMMIDQKQLFRNFQIECAEKQFELETTQAEDEYMAEKQGLREKMLAGVEERRRKLKEDKDNLDISNDVVIESQTRLHKRNLRKRGMEQNETKASKRKQMQAPPFTPGLKEEDLLADLLAMRKGMTSTKKTTVKAKK